MHFTTLPQIRGSLSATGAVGLDLPGNPNAGALQVLNLGVSGGVSPSFDVATLDTREFTRGILEPIEIRLFKYLWDRDFPEQLLFYLLVSKFEQIGPGAGRRVVANDPSSRRRQADDEIDRCVAEVLDGSFADAPPCDRFRDVVEAVTRSGRVSFNAYTQLRPVGPAIPAADVRSKPDVIARLGQADTRLLRAGDHYQIHHATEEIAICELPGEGTRRPGPAEPPPRARPGARERFRLFSATATHRLPAPPDRAGRAPTAAAAAQRHDPCHHREVVVDADATAEAGGGTNDFRVYPRSVDEVFTHLGAVVRRREEDGVPIDFVPSPRRDPRPRERSRLFDLRRDGAADARFSVAYRGDRYFVGPQTPTDSTLLVLSLLARLLNVHKASAEIPTTRAVQLVR
jgi:hypothetical protein